MHADAVRSPHGDVDGRPPNFVFPSLIARKAAFGSFLGLNRIVLARNDKIAVVAVKKVGIVLGDNELHGRVPGRSFRARQCLIIPKSGTLKTSAASHTAFATSASACRHAVERAMRFDVIEFSCLRPRRNPVSAPT